MKITLTLAAALVIALGGAAGCSKTEPSANTNTGNTAASTPSTTNPGTRTPPPENISTGSLATPTEAYRTAYAARKNADIAALKKVFSKDALEFLEIMGDGKQTLDEQLKELVKEPQASSDDARNEKITGNTATIEYKKDETTWKTMDFIKEGSEWKITFPKGDPKDKGPKQPD